MYIKVYFSDKPLFLCDALNEEINAYAHHDDAIFIDEFSGAALNSMIHEMRTEKVHAGIFYHSNLEELKKAFWKKFKPIQAGGGLVRNEKDELLFIFRRGKWDLPKGKLDPGETIEACALREVREETGIDKVSAEGFLLHTYHTYDENGKHFLKETSWYTMRSDSKEKLIAQAEEQITALSWVSQQSIAPMVANTYHAILDVLKAGGVYD